MVKDKIFDGANEKAHDFYNGWNKKMPDHLSMDVLLCCMFVYQGKDAKDKLRRFEQCRKDLTQDEALWVMSLLMLEKVIDLAGESDEAQTFYEQIKNVCKETKH